jgi:hypothetical protein
MGDDSTRTSDHQFAFFLAGCTPEQVWLDMAPRSADEIRRLGSVR